MARDCFADEVAIDFPHVGQVVERMRARFLGADPGDSVEADQDLVRAELRLSRRAARAGGVMPLKVAIHGTCARCGGRGESWAEPCGECRGTGATLVHHGIRVSVPAGVTAGARLRFRMFPPAAAPVRVEVRVAICSSAA